MGILDRIAAIQGASPVTSFAEGQNFALSQQLAREQNARASQRSVLEALQFGLRENQFSAEQAERERLLANQNAVNSGVADVLTGQLPVEALAVLGPQGRQAASDVRSLTAPAKDNRPASLRVFEAFQGMSPEEQKAFLDLERAQRPTTTVRVGEGAKALDKERGKQAAELLNRGLAAQRNLPQLQALRALVATTPTGFGEQTKNQAVRIFEGLGVNTGALSRVTNAQQFQALINEQVLQKFILQKGPQTEGDARRVASTLPSIENTQEANEFIVNSAIGMAQRESDIAEFTDLYFSQNPDDFAGHRRSLGDWIKKTPIFTRDQNGGFVFFHDFPDIIRSDPRNAGATDAEILKLWQDNANPK